MRIYFDACCLNRPFDDQSEERVRLETDALQVIWAAVERGEHTWVTSRVVEDEILQTADPDRRHELYQLHGDAEEILPVTAEAEENGKLLFNRGFPLQDALHLATAIGGNCHVLLTTDDVLLRKSRRFGSRLGIRVMNPLDWMSEERRHG